MKQLLNILTYSIILILLCSGCNQASKIQNNSRSYTVEMNDKGKTSEDNTFGNGTEDKNPNNQTNDGFYGRWLIKRTIAFSKVSALSDEDIAKLIGTRLEYSSNAAIYGKNICKSPKYKQTVVSEKDFFENNGYTSFEELGLQGKNVVMVEVFKEKEDYSNFWFNIGGRFYISNKNSLIANYEGVFFELVKDE